MQIRSKAYRHFVSICRSLRELTSPSGVPTPTSSSLAYTAAVLTLLFIIFYCERQGTAAARHVDEASNSTAAMVHDEFPPRSMPV